jgi:hypothetical protein
MIIPTYYAVTSYKSCGCALVLMSWLCLGLVRAAVNTTPHHSMATRMHLTHNTPAACALRGPSQCVPQVPQPRLFICIFIAILIAKVRCAQPSARAWCALTQKYSAEQYKAEVRRLQTGTSKWYLSILKEPPDLNPSSSESELMSPHRTPSDRQSSESLASGTGRTPFAHVRAPMTNEACANA